MIYANEYALQSKALDLRAKMVWDDEYTLENLQKELARSEAESVHSAALRLLIVEMEVIAQA